MRRAVRSIICFVAAALIVFGGLEIGLEYARHRTHHTEISLWHCVIATSLIVVGIVLFAGSESLAEQLTDDIEDGDEDKE
jgi:hypothetical protein